MSTSPGRSLQAKGGGCPQQDQGRDPWLLTQAAPDSSSQGEPQEPPPPPPPRAPIVLGCLCYWGQRVDLPARPWFWVPVLGRRRAATRCSHQRLPGGDQGTQRSTLLPEAKGGAEDRAGSRERGRAQNSPWQTQQVLRGPSFIIRSMQLWHIMVKN